MITLGLVSDTHVPDRTKALHPALGDYLASVDQILHAGDICLPYVLRELGKIAPVTAVGGNADWMMPYLPLQRRMVLAGVPLMLTHSHGGLSGYLYERYVYRTRGYSYEFHYERILRAFRKEKIIVFGHTHLPYLRVHGDQLLINPGSLGPTYVPGGRGPSAGRLTLDGGSIAVEIIDLNSQTLIQSIHLETSVC